MRLALAPGSISCQHALEGGLSDRGIPPENSYGTPRTAARDLGSGQVMGFLFTHLPLFLVVSFTCLAWGVPLTPDGAFY
jgi:hypothetical protein